MAAEALNGVSARALPVLAACLVGVQVGLSTVASRYVVADIGPATLALMRYAIGFACLLPVALSFRTRIAARHLLPIALLGIGQFAVLVALLNFAVLHITAGRAAIILSAMPLLTLAFAVALRHEAFSLGKLAGIVLTIAGVAVALGARLPQVADAAPLYGEIAAVAAAVVGAVCSVLYRPYLARYPVLPVSTLAMFASVAALIVPAVMEGSFARPPQLGLLGWSCVGGIGLGSAVGYWLWLWALSRADASRVTIFLSLSPVTALVVGAAWLGEPLTGALFAGVALVAAGLAVAQAPMRRTA